MAAMAPQLGSFDLQKMAQAAPTSEVMNQPLIPSTAPVQETLPQLQSIAPVEQAVSNSSVAFGSSQSVIPQMAPAAKIPTKMKVISTIAALRGDFGMMMNLMQQERKANFWNEFQNVMPEVNKRAGKGDTAGAMKLFNEALGRLGSANPEAAALMQPLQAKFYEKDEVLQFAESSMVAEKLRFAELPLEKQDDKYEKTRHQAILLGIQEMGKQPTKRSADDYFNRYLAKSIHPAPWARKMVAVDQMGNMVASTVDEGFDAQNLKGRIGDTMSSMFKTTPNEVVNVMNNPRDPRHPLFKQAYGYLAGRESDIAMRAAAPLSPEETRAQRLELESIVDEKGNRRYSDEQISEMLATGVYNKGVGNINAATRARMIEESARIKEATLRVDTKVPLQASERALMNFGILGGKASGDQFLMPRYDLSIDEANASGGKYRVVTKKVEEDAKAIGNAIANLNSVVEMFQYAGNPEGTPERLVRGARQQLIELFGTETPSDVSTILLAGMIKDNLEVIQGKMALPNADKGVANRLITGKYADANAAIEGLKPFLDAARGHIDRLMGESAASINKQIESPRRTRMNTPAPVSVSDLQKASGLVPKDKKVKGGPYDTADVMIGPTLVSLAGMASLDAPLESSKNWQEASKSIAVEGTATGRQLAEVVLGIYIQKMNSLKIPDAQKYLLTPEDTVETAIKKIDAAYKLTLPKRPKGIGKLGPPAS